MPGLGQRVVGGLVLALALRVATAAPPSPPKTFECEYVVRTPVYGVVDRAKYTSKGDLVRYQKRSGAGLKLLFLRNRQGTYQLNMHTNDGAKYGPDWVKNSERLLVTPGPQGDPKVFLKGVRARRTGREKVNGRTADVWTYDLPTVMQKPIVVHLYMDQREQRPVKVETRMQLSQGKGIGRTDIVTIEYASYRWGFPLPDSFFDLPKGAKLVDLGTPEAIKQLRGVDESLKRSPGRADR
jgi:hypothetical protein